LHVKTKIYTCPICQKPHKNQDFAANYKVLVCRKCEKGAVNKEGKEPIHYQGEIAAIIQYLSANISAGDGISSADRGG